MYSDKKSILQLAALLKAHGIKDVVLCPGSRNAPIVHTLSAHPSFECYSMTDERSAGFFAIGLALNSKMPTAVCCTSGTALLNLHPAVAEAFYQQVPLIIISADRPAAWIGQMDGQTLPQPDVFQGLVRKSVNLPEISTEEDEWYCNRLINEALLDATFRIDGPVHINIPISEPLYQFTIKSLPEVRKIVRYEKLDLIQGYCSALNNQITCYTKRMIIVGQTNDGCYSDSEDVRFFRNNFVCLAEHIGMQTHIGETVGNFDAALYAMPEKMQEQLAPELLITFGGHIVSKRLKKFLRQHPPKAHWHISPNGEIVDLFGALTNVVCMKPKDFLMGLHYVIKDNSPKYSRLWRKYCETIPEPEFAYSEMSAVGMLIKSLPEESILHLANSSTVRYAQLYSLAPSVRVYCNRGTSGIEGSLSTAVGYAASSDKLNFVVIGDLSFFYDMNALWNGNIRSNLRILLLNNGGGEIFHTLPGLDMNVAQHSCIEYFF